MPWQEEGSGASAGASDYHTIHEGAQIAAASSITVTDGAHEITGSGTINTISGLPSGAFLYLRFAAGSSVSLGSSGNIKAGSGTRTPERCIVLRNVGGTWYDVELGVGSGDFVNVTGDVMTGDLRIGASGTPSLYLGTSTSGNDGARLYKNTSTFAMLLMYNLHASVASSTFEIQNLPGNTVAKWSTIGDLTLYNSNNARMTFYRDDTPRILVAGSSSRNLSLDVDQTISGYAFVGSTNATPIKIGSVAGAAIDISTSNDVSIGGAVSSGGKFEVYQGGTSAAYRRFEVNSSGDVNAQYGYMERGRTVAQGDDAAWSPTRGYAGGGSWTGGTVNTGTYSRVGEKVHVMYQITSSTITGTVNSLTLTAPVAIAHTFRVPFTYIDGSTLYTGTALFSSGGSTITLYPGPSLSAFPVTTTLGVMLGVEYGS